MLNNGFQWFCFLTLTGFIALTQSVCTPAPQVKHGASAPFALGLKTLRFGTAAPTTNLDIAVGGGAYLTAALRPLHANLVALNTSGALKAELAKSWTVSSDHKQYSFCLESAQFQDGSAIRPEDVQFSLSRLAHDQQAGYVSRLMQLINPEVLPPENPGSGCLRVVLEQPYANFLYLLTSPFAAIQKKFDDLKCQGSCLAFAGGFAGNYRLQAIDAVKKTVEYKRVRGSSRWDTIEVQTIPDASFAVERIKDGSLDAYMGLIDFQKVVAPPASVCQTYWDSMSYGNFKFNSGWLPIINESFRKDLAQYIQATVRESLETTVPLEFTTSLLSQGLVRRKLMQPAISADELGKRLIHTWNGHVPKGRFRVISRLNMVHSKALVTMKRDLQAIGLDLEYLHGMSEDVVVAVKRRDFEVAFGTWAASFNRPEEFLNMAHRLLVPEMERFPQLRSKIADLEQTIFLADGLERDREFIRIFNEIQDMAVINPVYKIHIPLLHSCRIKSQVAAWQFHPRLESLMLKGEL